MLKDSDAIGIFLLIVVCLSSLHFYMYEIGNYIHYKHPIGYLIERKDGKIIIKNYEGIDIYVEVETESNKYRFYDLNNIFINETGKITIKIVESKTGEVLISRTFYINSANDETGENSSAETVVDVDNSNA